MSSPGSNSDSSQYSDSDSAESAPSLAGNVTSTSRVSGSSDNAQQPQCELGPTEGQISSLGHDAGELMDGVATTASEATTHSPKAVRGWHRGLLLVTLLLTLGYSIGLPLLKRSIAGEDAKPTPFRAEVMPLGQAIQVHTMEAFAVLWVLSLGSTVGSFLNVVVYRMPRGKSVIFNPSRCPKCNSNIRPTDNVPIFGWLRLEGQCRDCRNPISARYPTVEAGVALIFLVLFAVELVSGGWNIPLRATNIYSGIVWILFEMRWDLIQLYLYHCILFCLLVSWILIDLDRQRVTWLAIAVGSAIMILPSVVLPHLQPVPIGFQSMNYPQATLAALTSSVVGGAVGLLVGLLLTALYTASSRRWQLQVHDGNKVDRDRFDPEFAKVSSIEPQPAVQLDAESNQFELQDAADQPESMHSSTQQPIQCEPVHQRIEEASHRNVLVSFRDYCIEPSSRNLISLILFLGFCLGWQSLLNVVLLALALRLFCWLPMSLIQFRMPLSFFVGVAAILHHCLWHPLFQLSQKTWLASSLGIAGFAMLVISLASANLLIADSTEVL